MGGSLTFHTFACRTSGIMGGTRPRQYASNKELQQGDTCLQKVGVLVVELSLKNCVAAVAREANKQPARPKAAS